MGVIAIIEDNEELRRLTAIFLQREGFDVICCEDAEAVFEINHQVSLYLVDLNLPEMDGYALIEAIRGSDRGAKIVVLSARDGSADVVRGYDIGVDVYLTKPVEPNVLLSVIRRLMASVPPTVTGSSQIKVSRVKQTVALGGAIASISPGELALLYALSISRGRGLERYEVANVLGITQGVNISKSIDVRIVRLRQKLAKIGCAPGVLQTLRGYGYRLNAQFIFE